MTDWSPFGVEPSRPALGAALVHVFIALGCAAALLTDGAAIGGVHPAVKPLKFGVSIAVFLATMAWILPLLQVDAGVRRALSWVLVVTMAAEMAPILVQAIRGTSSHFNQRSAADALVWSVMVGAIVVATLSMLGIAALATWRPLGDGQVPRLLAVALCAGLWLFLVAAYTGFRMGGAGRHSVGGEDGGPGLPLTHWSTAHGDLRVAHFFALHGLQLFPGVALVLLRSPLSEVARWSTLATTITVYVTACVFTLVRAHQGRPSF